jgi:hypothetical protein
MAKKPAAPKTQAPQANKQLVDAIIAVKHLQDFINAHGSVEKAIGAVDRVNTLCNLTGSFAQLKAALEIVGTPEPVAPPAE